MGLKAIFGKLGIRRCRDLTAVVAGPVGFPGLQARPPCCSDSCSTCRSSPALLSAECWPDWRACPSPSLPTRPRSPCQRYCWPGMGCSRRTRTRPHRRAGRLVAFQGAFADALALHLRQSGEHGEHDTMPRSRCTALRQLAIEADTPGREDPQRGRTQPQTPHWRLTTEAGMPAGAGGETREVRCRPQCRTVMYVARHACSSGQ
jgi:hypothetical protein